MSVPTVLSFKHEKMMQNYSGVCCRVKSHTGHQRSINVDSTGCTRCAVSAALLFGWLRSGDGAG